MPRYKGQWPVDIPAWANGPGFPAKTTPGPTARSIWTGVVPLRPFNRSIPNIGFVIFYSVLFQKHSKFILKCPRPMMALLIVDVGPQGLQVRRAHGKTSVPSLPRKRHEIGRLSLHPFRGRRFQRLYQIRDRNRARKADREMNMVSHSSDAVRLATFVARDGRQIRVKSWARGRIKEWPALLCAEDDVDNHEAQGLWHTDGAGFQPFVGFDSVTWGVAPGWDGVAPLARQFTRFFMALRHCPC